MRRPYLIRHSIEEEESAAEEGIAKEEEIALGEATTANVKMVSIESKKELLPQVKKRKRSNIKFVKKEAETGNLQRGSKRTPKSMAWKKWTIARVINRKKPTSLGNKTTKTTTSSSLKSNTSPKKSTFPRAIGHQTAAKAR